jgi:hypothetical protein
MATPEESLSGLAFWARALAVTGAVVTVMLAARELRPLVETATFLVRTGHPVFGTPPPGAWVRAGAWLAIAVAVLLRLRVVAALGAWAAVVYEAVVLVLAGRPTPGFAEPWLLRAWPLLLATGAAVLLTASVQARPGLDPLRRGGRWLLAVAAAVTALSAVAVPLLGTYSPPPPEPVFSINVDNAVHGGMPIVALLLVLAAVGFVERGVRPRVYALIAVIVAAYVVLQLAMPLPFGTAGILPTLHLG